MFLVLLACSTPDPALREVGEHLDRVVAETGVPLARVSCASAEAGQVRVPAFGCVYRGSEDDIGRFLLHYAAEPGPPDPRVSRSPCVRENREIGQLLPGSDDWYPKDGAVTWHPAAPLPARASRRWAFGDVQVAGDRLCIEVTASP